MWIYNDGLLQEESLLKLGVKHFCTTKSCGNMLDDSVCKKLFDKLNTDYASLVTAGQVHGNIVVLVKPADRGRRISNIDGMVLETEGIPIGIYTADCVPLFIVDKKSGKLGLVHVGWRGLAKGIVENGINQFNNKGDIFIGIGPHICKKCYAVGESVSGKFPESYSDGHLDLTCEIKLRLLRQCGIPEKNIHAGNDCTYHNRDKFYSYRRGDLNSRMISVMML